MSVTVKYRVNFPTSRPRNATRAPRSRTVATERQGSGTGAKASETADTAPPCRAARMLALAHHIEQLIEIGELKNHSEAARLLGLTRARMTQVMNLLTLSPRIQEKILTGDLRVSERGLRRVTGTVEWEAQQQLLPE